TTYRLTLDAVVDSDLRLLISTPFTNLIHFQSNGNVVVIIRDATTGSQDTTTVASYTPGDGVAHAVVVHIDLENDVFELVLDGVSVHLATFGAQSALTQFRLFGTHAAVDNIVLDTGARETEIVATLDIRPRSDGPAPVNLDSCGVVPMAMLGSEDLDVLTIDRTSLGVLDGEGEAIAVAPRRVRVRDVNDDGFDDLLLHVSTVQLVGAGVLTPTTTALTVLGETLDGVALRGADEVRVVAPRRRWRRAKSTKCENCAKAKPGTQEARHRRR
ncbi:MAG: hypothetical protein P1V36_06680, partial [Planctomycetota bacterium]|nr:hypothetical protein [Planctomycetota bacterium]